MLQQITAPYRNQTLKLINSEDVLKGVLFYKKKKKGDFTSLLSAWWLRTSLSWVLANLQDKKKKKKKE